MKNKEVKKLRDLCRILRAGKTIANREAVLHLARPSLDSSDTYRECHQSLLDNNFNRDVLNRTIDVILTEMLQ